MKAENSDWFIVQMYPETVYEKMLKQSRNIAYILEIAVSISAIIVAFVVVITLAFEHKEQLLVEEKEKRELLESINRTKKQLSLLYALSTDIADLMIVDFDKDTSMSLKSNYVFIPEEKRVEKSYSEMCKIFNDRFIVADDKEKASYNFTKEKVIKDIEVKGESVFTFRIRTKTGLHYSLARFVKLPNSDDGYLMALNTIDSQIAVQYEKE